MYYCSIPVFLKTLGKVKYVLNRKQICISQFLSNFQCDKVLLDTIYISSTRVKESLALENFNH